MVRCFGRHKIPRRRYKCPPERLEVGRLSASLDVNADKSPAVSCVVKESKKITSWIAPLTFNGAGNAGNQLIGANK